MTPIRIKVIWAKRCPKCKELLKKILLPIQRMLPDLVVIDLREVSMDIRDEGKLPLISGGMYHTLTGITPEIYIEDKVYILGSKDPEALLKFLHALIDVFNEKKIYEKMSVYRELYIRRKLIALQRKLIREIQKKREKSNIS